MTDPVTPAAALPSPAAALVRAFTAVLHDQMQGMPMLNPALGVEALGFRPWADHWLGILITPWFMNLVLMPRIAARWEPIGDRESRHHLFPAGVFEFIGGRTAATGDYQACSLFSPMFEFADPQEARATALAALDALFDVASREGLGTPARVAAPAAAGATAGPAAIGPVPAGAVQTGAPVALSKRNFLFGAARAPHED
jgi:[NiFe] hydrogenase assembly HybE family chaperone